MGDLEVGGRMAWSADKEGAGKGGMDSLRRERMTGGSPTSTQVGGMMNGSDSCGASDSGGGSDLVG